MIPSRSIVFIHGLFQNQKSWNGWGDYFEAKGFKCYTPAYPFHVGEPSDLRGSIDADLKDLTFGKVIMHLAAFLDTLPTRPILIGHSIGGLAVQKLMEMGKCSAGVCISSAPPNGIFSFKWSFLKANLPLINPLKGDSVCVPTVEWFHYAICNTMSIVQAQMEYDMYVVPESRNIPKSSLGKEGKINFRKPHNPLLFIAGEKDHIIPPTLNKKNYLAYKNKSSKRDFKIFNDRTHYICRQPKWEEVAFFINEWIETL